MKDKLRSYVARQLEERVQRLLSKNSIKIVAITGSVGKTSTKLAIAEVLSAKYKVLAHSGNYNSEISVPLTFFEMDVPQNLFNPLNWWKALKHIDKRLEEPYPYNVVVVEMGADQPGDIQKFMHYIKPDVGVVTAIQPVHLEGFKSIQAIEKEKLALAKGSNQVLINADDTGVVRAAQDIKHKTYGLKEADFVLPEVKLLTPGSPALSVAAAAYAVGRILDVPEKDILHKLQNLPPVPGRMNILDGKRGSRIIDDSYNASPKAVIEALRVLYGLPTEGRRIAILGNMNELGMKAKEEHQRIGKLCGQLDMLLTIGDNANDFIAGSAQEAGLDKGKIHRFSGPYEAGLFLDDRLRKGDLVLVKGSQNRVFAEEAVAQLLAHPEDRKQLVRQGERWDRRKREQFGVK